MRKQARRIPDSARDRRAGTVDGRFLLPEWRGKLFGLDDQPAARSSAEWRPGDLRRHSELIHIINEWKTYAAARRLERPGTPEAEVDQGFCRRYGDGHFFGRKLKPDTLRKWRTRCRSGGTFRETRGRKRSSYTNSIGALARARFLGEYLNAGVGVTLSHQTTAAEANRHAGDPQWSFPSEATVRRWIKKDWPEFYTAAYRKGWRHWRAEFQPKLIRDQHSLPANELWEIDGTTADYFLRLNGRKIRPTVINVVDVATGLVVGWAVGRSESQPTILTALRRAIEHFGIPLQIRTDLGKAFLGQAVGDAMGRRMDVDVVGVFEQLAISLENTTGHSPWQKGNSESVFNAFRQRYAPLHGKAFIGNSHKNRTPGVDHWANQHPDQLKTIEEDDRLVGEFFEAENRRPRRQLGGVSPLQKFEATAIPERSVPPEMLNYFFGRTQRTRVTNKGIPVTFGQTRIWYGAGEPRVWELIGRKVVVRINDDAPAWIWLCDQRGQALFKVLNDEVRGLDGPALREAGKRQAKARKRVRDRWEDADIVGRHSIDEALRLQREYADAQAAKVAGKMPARQRGKTVVMGPAADVRKTIRREELRAAAGAESMTTVGPTLTDIFADVQVDRMDIGGVDIRDINFGVVGQGDHDDGFDKLVRECQP